MLWGMHILALDARARSKEFERRWKFMTESERVIAIRARFEDFPSLAATGIHATNLAGIAVMLFFLFWSSITPSSDLTVEQQIVIDQLAEWIFASLLLLLAVVPWMAIRWNGIGARAKQYGVYRVGRQIKILDIAFATVILECILLVRPEYRNWASLGAYFALASIMEYILVAWVFFNRPPRN